MTTLDNKDKKRYFLALDEIQDALECVVCLDLPKDDQVYQCENGHILCNICREKLTNCPFCRVILGRSRNLSVEKILAKCPRTCEFGKYGCRIKLNKQEQATHQENCRYKPVHCVYPHCNELLSVMFLGKHLSEKHGNIRSTVGSKISLGYNDFNKHFENQNKVDVPKPLLDPLTFTFDGFFFCSVISRTFVPLRPYNWHLWLCLAGSPEESKCYNYIVSIKNSENKEELSYTGNAVSLQLSSEQVISMGRCLTFDDEIAKRFCSGRQLEFDFHIRLNHATDRQSNRNLPLLLKKRNYLDIICQQILF